MIWETAKIWMSDYNSIVEICSPVSYWGDFWRLLMFSVLGQCAFLMESWQGGCASLPLSLQEGLWECELADVVDILMSSFSIMASGLGSWFSNRRVPKILCSVAPG